MEHIKQRGNKNNTFIQLASNYHPTIKFMAVNTDAKITFLGTCIYKGKRLRKESVYSRQTHVLQTNRNFLVHPLHLLSLSRHQEMLHQRQRVYMTSEKQFCWISLGAVVIPWEFCEISEPTI